MATVEQIIEGIKRADAAGDADAVRALGEAYRAMTAGSGANPADDGTRPDMELAMRRRAHEMREEKLPSQLQAGVLGGLQGAMLNFGDEAVGGVTAGMDMMRGRAPDGFGAAYDRRTQQARNMMEDAQERFPGTFLGGNIAGGVGSAMALPLKAAPVLGGALYGAVAGAGDGEDMTSRATGALIGSGAGAGLGYVAPKAIDFAVGTGKAAYNAAAPRFVSAFNPELAAQQRVGAALQKDVGSGSAQRLDDADFNQSLIDGQSPVLVDRGGESTRSLMRSATNQSPDARQTVADVVEPRFSMEGPRISNFLSRITGSTGDNAGRIESLQNAARRANRYRYAAAERSPNASALWDRGFEQLSQAPAVQTAIREATERGANKAASGSSTPVRNPFVMDPQTERFVLRRRRDGSVAVPNLPFWDVVKQSLDDQYSALARAGKKGEAGDILDLINGLKGRLDSAVPEYAVARRGAAAAFDAEDAVEAGAKFVTSRMENPAARRAFAAMSQPERELFATGYANQLMARIGESKDRIKITKELFGSPAQRERIEIALGPQRAAQMEAFIRRENIMDMARTALGNSSTYRQMVEAGLLGGTGLYGLSSGNPEPFLLSLLAAGLSRGRAKVNANVAERVAKLLMSDDPAALQRAQKAITQNASLRANFEQFEGMLGGLVGNLGAAPSVRALGGPLSSMSGEEQPAEGSLEFDVTPR
jgi:hypothetical protein